MRQPKIAILLLLTFLTLLLAPVRANWACPDGTPCVASPGRGFECAEGQCATRRSCCERDTRVRCRHGAFPAVEAPGTTRLQETDHCRFNLSARPRLAAKTEPGATLGWLACDFLPASSPVELEVASAPAIWLAEYTLGYRPPPHRRTGPSRAPPVA